MTKNCRAERPEASSAEESGPAVAARKSEAEECAVITSEIERLIAKWDDVTRHGHLTSEEGFREVNDRLLRAIGLITCGLEEANDDTGLRQAIDVLVKVRLTTTFMDEELRDAGLFGGRAAARSEVRS